MYKHTQRSFTGGVLDRALMGRQDLEKYFKGASVLRNMLVRRQGNVSKRRGTDQAADVTGLLGHDANNEPIRINRARVIPLVFDRDEGYHVLMTGRRAYLCSRKGVRAQTYSWLREIPDYDGTVDYAQKGTVSSEWPAMIGEEGYDSIAAAFAAAEDGDTVRLYADAVLDDPSGTSALVVDAQGTVTLDLNGHEIVAPPTKYCIDVSGMTTLVIVDSTGGGKVRHPDGGSAKHMFVVRADASLVIRAGTYQGNCQFTSDHAYSPVRLVAGSSLTIEAGVFSNLSADGVVISFGGAVTINVNGGFFKPGCPMIGFLYENRAAVLNSTITFNGGLMACTPVKCVGGGGNEVRLGFVVNEGSFKFFDGDPYWEWAAQIGSGMSGGHFLYNMWETPPIGDSSILRNRVATGATYNTSARRNLSFYGVPGLIELSVYVGSKTYGDWDTEEAHWAGGGGTPPPVAVVRPYYTAIPYDDADLQDVNYTQSGDTLFLAHRNYPPATISFNPTSRTIAYAPIDFVAPWSAPILTSLGVGDMNKTTKSATATATTTTSYDKSTGQKTITVKDANGDTKNTATSTQPLRTVTYCVSYVKDGRESPPSNAMSATYVAPWQEGDKIRVNFAKGDNAAQPDEYRIYKKEGTDFGLIGTVQNTTQRALLPRPSVPATATFASRGSFTPAQGAASDLGAPTAEDVAGRSPTQADESWTLRRAGTYADYDLHPGAGGLSVPADKYATFTFGASANVSLSSVTAYVDSHSLRYVETQDGLKVYDDIALSGPTIVCRVTYRDRNGTTTTTAELTATPGAVTYVDEELGPQSATTGSVSHYAGVVPPGTSRETLEQAVNQKPRAAKFALSAYSDKSIVKVAFCAKSGATRVPLELAGLKLAPASQIGSYFDDDYITPDMSETPVEPAFPFSGEGNYPACVAIHQQRLVFASTRNDPTALHMSATGDLLDFSPHKSIREDDPITFSLAATELPDVNHIVVTRDVVLLADGGEWKVAPVTGNTLSYKTLSCTLQSRKGSAKNVTPMAIGDEVVFAEASGQSLLATKYNYASDGYETTDLTVLSSDLFRDNRIVQGAYEQFPDSRIWCALADGRMAVMVYMPEHEVAAWSEVVLGGQALAKGVSNSKAVVGTTSDTMVLAAMGEDWLLWAVRPDLPRMDVGSQASLDGVVRLLGADAATAWKTGWIAVDVLTAQTYATKAALQAAEGYAARTYVVGFPFEAELATVRPEPPSSGTIQFELKNAKDIEVRVLDGGSWRAAPMGYVDHPTYAQHVRTQVSVQSGALALDSSDHILMLTGNNTRDGRIQIKSDDPWPLSILSLSTNYEIQPLANMEG